MKRKLLVLGLIPLLFSLAGCSGEDATLKDEVEFIENYEVKELLSYEKCDEIYEKVYDNFLMNLVEARTYEKSFEDLGTASTSYILVRSEPILHRYLNQEKTIVTKYFANDYVESHIVTDEVDSKGGIIIKDSYSYSTYNFASREHAMIARYIVADDYTYLVRNFLDEQTEPYDTRTEEEIAADFYNQIYAYGDEYLPTDGLPIYYFDGYQVDDGYMFIYTKESFTKLSVLTEKEDYVSRSRSQYIIKVNNDNYATEYTDYYEITYGVRNNISETFEIGTVDYTKTTRKHFSYGTRFNGDRVGVRLAENEVSKGFIDQAYFVVEDKPSTIAVDEDDYIYFPSPRKASVGLTLELVGGTAGANYMFQITYMIRTTTDLYQKGNKVTVIPEYTLDSPAKNYVSYDNEIIEVKYHLFDEGDEAMYIAFGIESTINEDKTISHHNPYIHIYSD